MLVCDPSPIFLEYLLVYFFIFHTYSIKVYINVPPLQHTVHTTAFIQLSVRKNQGFLQHSLAVKK